MNNFIKSSIGQKFFMSLTGLFLIVFLVVHLIMNILLLFDKTGDLYNLAAHFMATNPLIRIVEPILAVGFIIHILYASLLTLQNQKARPVGYAVNIQHDNTRWSSQNMFILGALVLTFLVMHLIHFFIKMKFGEIPKTTIEGTEIENAYLLVTTLFKEYIVYDIMYVAGAVFLGLHLQHAFWSAFQTLGLSNHIWHKRLEILGTVYTIVVAGGFAIIPVLVFLGF